MSFRYQRVNLDAMIPREDFAVVRDSTQGVSDSVAGIPLRDLERTSIFRSFLKKPDFQRETNHWTAEQIASLIECFLDGDLIPAVILWRSPSNDLFVIDGGHRLSALRAWVEDDYGDGQTSGEFFGSALVEKQRAVADYTRKLVEKRVGNHRRMSVARDDAASYTSQIEKARALNLSSRVVKVQWLSGQDPDKAEQSFFKINAQGTPIDPIEEDLLKNRRKSIAIAARAILRAGTGNKYYWARIPQETQSRIEATAKRLHELLFSPNVLNPIKTLDLPLGGSKSVRDTLKVLMEFLFVTTRESSQIERSDKRRRSRATFSDFPDDENGEETLKCLSRAQNLLDRITGSGPASLGLHPAVYFYGSSGKHVLPFFMGTNELIKQKLENNDDEFFKRFTAQRRKIEDYLILHKDLIRDALQKLADTRRVTQFGELLMKLVSAFESNQELTRDFIGKTFGLDLAILTGAPKTDSRQFDDNTKSAIYLASALPETIRCKICTGLIDAKGSFQYDHIKRVREGGVGTKDNGQLTHPFCNTGIKN
jgi:hypothetical protein